MPARWTTDPLILANIMSQLTVFLRHAKRSNNKELDLSHRELSSIPREVYSIRAIETLVLSNNKIENLEPAITELIRLKFLDLDHNLLTELPEEIAAVPKLTVLTLKGNPLNQKFKALLLPQNSKNPGLEQTLHECFSGKPSSETPSWLKGEHQDSLEDGISWDKTLFKQDKKKPETLRRGNQPAIEPENSSKNGVLEVKGELVELEEQISMGGFSTIHRGRYMGLEVAVKKVFNPNIGEELLKEFNNEISLLAKYRHPNIILLLGAVTVPPTLCVLMEYVKEGSLYDWLHKRKARLQLSDKTHILRQILSVFTYLHKHGIVHRDIKSHNILLNSALTLKLCDFGLARHKSELNTGSMQFCGTPTYMAQELFLKKGYDESVDIFALGTLIYELYSGDVPYAGLDPADLKDKILKDHCLPYSVNVSKPLLELVNRCRHPDPPSRPSLQQLTDFEW